MDPDGVSVMCDEGAHERCLGCACGCHSPHSSPALGVAGEALPPDVDVAPSPDPSAGVGSQICRECAEGKHGACNGEAIVEWDDDSLTLAPCICAIANHESLVAL